MRPLTEEEKMAALRDGAKGTLEEMQRRADDLRAIGRTAHTIFGALMPKHSPVIHIQEAPLPDGMEMPPVEQLWSVTPKVTFKQ